MSTAQKDPIQENLKPKRGMLVLLADAPGVWQVLDPAPTSKDTPPGTWWLSPWDDDSRGAPKHPVYGSYRAATYRTMKPASTAGRRNE